ncbi:MAG: deoxyguanosinetriphosphate triphosphohydrolase [Gammaproteobacteria bacterium]|nr:deoxyguanosinetriphosphate triphosphohydrolase [Gammaproteobacteria bacterium]
MPKPRMISACAVSDERSAGRQHPEPAPEHRAEFQRDRDRVIHSTAFRRLEYKTQVFVNHEGDLFRTRLTHSIEVAQIARSIARALALNEDLTEAIALAHDLGHTPFGHSGQDALNECMRPWGGFEHNLQSLRVVDKLEERYAEFSGLNLCFETREGILKHCSKKNAERLGTVGRRFLVGGQPSLEAQVADAADEIAYNNHDVDDGLRCGLLSIDQLRSLALFSAPFDEVSRRYPQLPPRRVIHETVRRMINRVVTDLIVETRRRIEQQAPDSPAAVRLLSAPLVGFSEDTAEAMREMKRYLRHNLYHHYRVRRMSAKARRTVSDIFSTYMDDPRLLPPQDQARLEGDDEARRARVVSDYLAGMTDRFAIAEHRRLFDPAELT